MQKEGLLIEASDKLINSSSIKKPKEVYPNIDINDITLNKDNKTINRTKGRYITISFNNDTNIDTLIDLLINYLKELNLTKSKKVLFVGLGNKYLSIDKLGYKVIEKIVVNNNYYKIYKNTEGITNINSKSFIKLLTKYLNVDLVVIIDSLKANNIERLGTTIQLSTGGIYINSENEISKKTIKCNIISIGIPLVINMQNINEVNPSLLITTNNVDELVETSSSIISIAINRLL